MSSHSKRLLGEHFWQLATVGITFADRIVVVGSVYRFWGKDVFELWASALALSGLLSLFDFGLNLYVSNTLSQRQASGNQSEVRRFLAVSNFMMLCCGAIGLLFALTICVLPEKFAGVGIGGGYQVAVTFLFLSCSTLVRISTGALIGLYRANGKFSRLTAILFVSELIRMGGVLGIAAAGFSPLFAGAWTLAVAAGVQTGFIVWDTKRSFIDGPIPVSAPTRAERRDAFRIASGYWAQTAPILVNTHLPVLALAALSAAPGVVSTFVFVRTMTGLPRAILQQLGIVSGQEIARLVATDDQPAARLAVVEATRTTSALSGLGAGMLVASGGKIGHLWVGDATIFTPLLLVVGLLPMLLAPGSVLAHNILASTNHPRWAAYGRWAQLGVGAVVCLVVPIPDPTLRVLLALSVGEVLAFAPLAAVGSRLVVPTEASQFQPTALLIALTMGVAAYTVTAGAMWLAGPGFGPSFLLAFFGSGGVCGLIFLFAGLSAAQRKQLFSMLNLALRPK